MASYHTKIDVPKKYEGDLFGSAMYLMLCHPNTIPDAWRGRRQEFILNMVDKQVEISQASHDVFMASANIGSVEMSGLGRKVEAITKANDAYYQKYFTLRSEIQEMAAMVMRYVKINYV